MAIEAAKIEPFVEFCQVKLILDYKVLDQFIRELSKVNGQVIDKSFGEHVTVIASLPVAEATALQKRFK